MKILIFTEGTITMHSSAIGKKRKQIVRQVQKKEKSVEDYTSYIPVSNAPRKLQLWKHQGAKIFYMTSRTKNKEIAVVKHILIKHGFPKGRLLYCRKNEEYEDVIEKLMPDIYIEDDCESIGKNEMASARLKPEIRKKIKVIVVKEFGGIDHMPDKISELKNYYS